MDAVNLFYSRLVFKKAQSIYELHRDLCRAFDGPRENTYLFRTDLDRNVHPVQRVVLVQSKKPGQWELISKLLSNYKQTQPKDWRFQDGDKYRFFLRANAIRRKKATLMELINVKGEEFQQARGKKVAIHGDEQLEAWLKHQGETHGFRLVENRLGSGGDKSESVTALRIFTGRDVHWSAKNMAAKHSGVDFEGLLEVVNPDKIYSAVANGIGPGKAFGFGLLSLAKLS